MRAVVFDSSLRLDSQRPCPAAEGEALVRTLVAGICNTDLELVKGYMGFRGVLGHEFVGVVEECSEPAWVGRRVVGEINCGCPDCLDPRHCPHRTVLGIQGRDGAMADRFRLPQANLLEVPRELADEVAVFTEPLAAAYEILEQTSIEPRHRVLVLGDGKLGALVAQVLATTGCSLQVVGKHDHKLGVLNELGISTVTLDRFGAAREWDVVVEASGSPSGFELAMELVRPRGRLVLKTTAAAAAAVNLAPLVIHEISVIGSRCGRFAPALEALARGKVVVQPLIERRYALDLALEAFRQAARPGAGKILLQA